MSQALAVVRAGPRDPAVQELRVLMRRYERGVGLIETRLTFHSLGELFSFCLAQSEESIELLTLVGLDEHGQEHHLSFGFRSQMRVPSAKDAARG